jgi:RNA polymerase sigma-70 factor (ECF subfamily)
MHAGIGQLTRDISREADEALAARAQTGDLRAYEELVKRYQRLVFRILWSRGVSGPDVEEVAQETFVRAWERLNTYDVTQPFKAWLARVASNLAVDRYRTQQRRPPSVELTEEHIAGPPYRPGDDPAASALEQERQSLLRTELKGLPDKYREALVLRFIEDLSYDEIATVLDIPLGSVKTRIFRGREMLKQRLYPDFSEGV